MSTPLVSAPSGRKPDFFRTPLFAGLFLGAAGLIAYFNSFSVPFVFDDEPSIIRNDTIRSLSRAWWPPQGGITVSGRPLVNLTLGINYAISGLDIWSYHAVNLLIHVAASLVLFGIVRRTLLQPILAPRFGPRSFEIALASAALWLLHPLQTESVTYVIQRAESLMALFYLLTIWCFIRSLEAKAHRKWTAYSLISCLLGMCTKEVMVSAPLLIALYDRIFVANSWREVWAQRRGQHLLLASTWLVLGGLVLSNIDRGGSAGFGMTTTPFIYAMTQVHAIGHYLWLTLWPSPLVLDYGGVRVTSWQQIAWSALFLFPLGAASLWAAWRGRPVGFCGILFFAVLAPTSSVLPLYQTMAEHRMYLPLAAVLTVIVVSTYRLLGNPGFVLLGSAAVIFTIVAIERNRDYASPIRIYEDTVAKFPSNARAMALLADYYNRAGRIQDARRLLERSLQVEPGIPAVLNNLGAVYLRLGDLPKAVECFKEALVIKPGDAALLDRLGTAQILSGQVLEGIGQLQAALRIAPDLPLTRLNLANALAQNGHPLEAAAHFEFILKAHPDNAAAHSGYANLLLSQDQFEEARQHLENAVHLQPNNADTRNQLGIALGRSGHLREALEQFKAAIQLDPSDSSARQNAAITARRLEGN